MTSPSVLGSTLLVALGLALLPQVGSVWALCLIGVPLGILSASRSAALLDVAIDEPGALELAKRSRGTPRIVNRLLKRVRDYAQVRGDGTISKPTVEAALTLEGVDEKGLTRLDHRYLKTIIDYYGGGPVGIEAISATLQEETDTLVDVVEPYLLKIGMVIRTSSGRRTSEAAYHHLGVPIQQKLF